MELYTGLKESDEIEDLTADVPEFNKDEDNDPFEYNDIDPQDARDFEEEDSWTVIAAHFHERGLVGQQLDSFDNFMTSTMQVSHYFLCPAHISFF